jgi:hypothetical protein
MYSALSYLQKVTQASMAEHVRQAILLYATQHPDFVAKDCRLSAEAHVTPEVVATGDSDLKTFFDSQLDMLTGGPPNLGSTGLPRAHKISSDPSHFDND